MRAVKNGQGKRRLGYLVCVGLTLVLAGCGTPRPTPITEADSTPFFEVRLVPGDEVDIRFFGAAELNVVQKIRPDGRIGLHLVDELAAAGKTVAELQRELMAHYKGQIQIQSITVIVRTSPSVIVSGSVTTPGRVEVTRPLTALDAVMEAGGFDLQRAEVRSVMVIRNEGQRYRGHRLDMRAALDGEGPAFYLRPNDIVYVPTTRIVAVNQWIEQYINNMLPRLGLGYTSDGEMAVYR